MITKLKSHINPLKITRDGKVIASNFGYLTLLQISSYLFPLMTLPYLARVIGVEGFGKIAFASGVMVWFKTISDWGFNYTATRDIAINRNDPEKVSEIFSQVLWARIILMFISFIILILLIFCVPFFYDNKEVLLISFLLIPGSIFFPEWFFQAMEQMKYITIFNLISKSLFTLLIFMFIKERADFILQPLFMSLGYIFCGMFAMYVILVKWKVKLQTPKFDIIQNTIKGSTDVFINNIMPNLYNSFSVVLLGFFGGNTANGILDAGSKFVGIVQQFLTIVSRVFFPLLSRKIHIHKLYAIINILLSILFFLLLLILSPYIISIFYTSEFSEATLVLQIMSSSVLFTALISTYGTNFMIIKGYTKELRDITTTCSIIGFLIAFPLISLYGYIGAAITITSTRALLGCSILYRATSIKKRLTHEDSNSS